MNPEKQRIAIAEFCGWKRLDVPYYGPFPYWDNPDGVYVGGGSWLPIPDYLNDLNAIHEAEEKLSEEQFYNYYHILITIWSRQADFIKDIHPIRATAMQRAEALLRTIGKWEE